MENVDENTGELKAPSKRVNTGPYTSITSEAAWRYCTDKTVTGGDAKVILGVLALAQKRGNLPFNSREIAEKMGRNQSGVHRALNKLIFDGFLVKPPGRSGYILNPYDAWNCDAEVQREIAREVDQYNMDAVMGAGTHREETR